MINLAIQRILLALGTWVCLLLSLLCALFAIPALFFVLLAAIFFSMASDMLEDLKVAKLKYLMRKNSRHRHRMSRKDLA